MYADDAKIFNDYLDWHNLQADLDRLDEYYKRIFFIHQNEKLNKFDYQVSKININKTELVRDLGNILLLDTKLSFSELIDTIIDRAFKGLGFILPSLLNIYQRSGTHPT